jgi:uncharacterized protein (TIGR02147 family)
MIASERVIRHLRTTFVELQNQREGYSLRRFARRLGVAAPVLSGVLNGKRKVTRNLAEKLLLSLQVAPDELQSLLRHFPVKQTRLRNQSGGAKPVSAPVEIDAAKFNLLSDWWHFAVLALAESSVCRSDPAWIAKRLAITQSQAAKAVDTLTRLDLVRKRGAMLTATGVKLKTTQDVPSVAIKRNHLQGLELARDALNRDLPADREFGSHTFCGDPDLLDAVKPLLREARARAVRVMESGEKRAVYRLQVQLFKLSKETGET